MIPALFQRRATCYETSQCISPRRRISKARVSREFLLILAIPHLLEKSLRLPRYIRRMLVPSLVQHVIISHVKDVDLVSSLYRRLLYILGTSLFSETEFLRRDSDRFWKKTQRGRNIVAIVDLKRGYTTREYLRSQSYILPLKIQLICRRWLSSRIMRVHLNKCYHRRISLASPLFKR